MDLEGRIGRVSADSVKLGTVVGLGFLSTFVGVWLWLGFGFDFRDLFETEPILASLAIVGFGGLILLGMIPTILLLDFRLISPALTVGGLFLWAVDESLHLAHDIAPPTGPRGIVGLGGFLHLWLLVLAAALLVGGAEYLVRTGGSRISKYPA